MSYRSSPSFAIGGAEQSAACLYCGSEVLGGLWPWQVRDVCCGCRGDHNDYEGGICIHCGQPRDDSPFEDDVGCGFYEPNPGPIGVPISALDSNAMQAGSDKWNNWLALCESWGHP